MLVLIFEKNSNSGLEHTLRRICSALLLSNDRLWLLCLYRSNSAPNAGSSISLLSAWSISAAARLTCSRSTPGGKGFRSGGRGTGAWYSASGLENPLVAGRPRGLSMRLSCAKRCSDLGYSAPGAGPWFTFRWSKEGGACGVWTEYEVGAGEGFLAGCSSDGPDRILAKDMGSAARAGFCRANN